VSQSVRQSRWLVLLKLSVATSVAVAAGYAWGRSSDWQWLPALVLSVAMVAQWLFGWDRSQSHSNKLRQPLLTALLGAAVGLLLLAVESPATPLWLLLVLLGCHFVLGSQPLRGGDERAE